MTEGKTDRVDPAVLMPRTPEVGIRLAASAREGGCYFVTSPDLPGFSLMLQPGDMISVVLKPLEAFLTAEYRSMDVNSNEAKLWSENMRLKSENEHLEKTLLEKVEEVMRRPVPEGGARITDETLLEKIRRRVLPTACAADDAQTVVDVELWDNVSKLVDTIAEFVGAVVQVELTKHRTGFGVDQARYHAARTEAVRAVFETIIQAGEP